MRQTPAQAIVTAFFASTLITIASGLGSAVYESYVQHHDASGEYGISLTSIPHPGTGQAAAVAGLGIFVAGCVAAALILAGWAQQVLGVTRFAAAVLGLVPLPALALPAIALGAGGGWVAGFGLGLTMAVVAYGILATGYAYSWTRMVGRWADSRSRRG